MSVRWETVVRAVGVALKLSFALTLGFALVACAPANFDLGQRPQEQSYSESYPYYAEICAVSALKKKPGFGFEYRGGPGGHEVLYLNGACRDQGEDYPTLRLCGPDETGPDSGVGLSANGHFSNANWVAVPGRDFFFSGGLPPGERLTRDSYARTQAEAKRLGIYDGVRFHDGVFNDMPKGWSRDDYKYEVSVASDYAIDFGRGRYCARLPVRREQMTRIIAFLNAENAKYRDGSRQYESNVIEDSCAHVVHNALAAADVWDNWPIDRFFVIAALDFPVPKNEFVNLMRQGNDLPIADLRRLHDDATLRQALLHDDWLPTQPGAIATSAPPRLNNDVYDTDVALIFYDFPVFGSYQASFDRIFTMPRYTSELANLRHFAALYARIKAERRPLQWWLASGDFPTAPAAASFTAFYDRYYNYIDHMSAEVDKQIAALNGLPRGQLVSGR